MPGTSEAVASQRPIPRVLVGAVKAGRRRRTEEIAQVVADEAKSAGLALVRCVAVSAEPKFLQQLVSNVSNDNEADSVILLGGTGFGPRDSVCEALGEFLELRIEGFAHAYRRMLSEELGLGPHSLLVRAIAGVYNKCLVFALTGRPEDVRRAMQALILPILSDAVELANGRMRAHDIGA